MKVLKLILPLINLLPESVIRLLGKIITGFLLSKYAELEIHGRSQVGTKSFHTFFP